MANSDSYQITLPKHYLIIMLVLLVSLIALAYYAGMWQAHSEYEAKKSIASKNFIAKTRRYYKNEDSVSVLKNGIVLFFLNDLKASLLDSLSDTRDISLTSAFACNDSSIISEIKIDSIFNSFTYKRKLYKSLAALPYQSSSFFSKEGCLVEANSADFIDLKCIPLKFENKRKICLVLNEYQIGPEWGYSEFVLLRLGKNGKWKKFKSSMISIS